LTINKALFGTKVTAHYNGSPVFTGLIEEFPAYVARGHRVDHVLIYEEKHIPSIQMSYQEFICLFGDPGSPE